MFRESSLDEILSYIIKKKKKIIIGIFPLQTTHNHLCQSF